MSLPTWKLVLDFGENSEFASRLFKSDVCPCRYCWSEKCGTSLLRFSHFSSLPDSSSSDSPNSLEETKWKLVLLFGDGSELCSQPLKPDSCPCGFCWCELRQSKRPQDLIDLRSFQKFLSAEVADSLGAIFSANESRIVKAETEDERCLQYLNGSDASDEANPYVKSKDLKVELVELEDDSEDENQDPKEDWKPKRGLSSEKAKAMLWCRECGKAVQGRPAMDQHLKAEHDSTRPFKCCLCTSRFITRKEMYWHFRKTHKDKDGRYKCNQCKFTTAYATNITKHVRVHSRKKLFECDRCDKAFFHVTNLSTHRKNIHGTSRALLESRQEEEGYENKIVDVGVPKADHIDTAKINRNTATNHELTLATPVGKPRLSTLTKKRRRRRPECGESSLETPKPEQLLKVHDPTQPFKCCLCSARFGTRQQKLRHQITHKDNSCRYNCNHCHYSTTLTQCITKHMRTHTGEKPYKCDQCPKSFSQSANLKSHVLSIHTDYKPFQCDKCPRAYAFPSLLRHHQKDHSRKTPLEESARKKTFGCTQCSKRYLNRTNLHKHRRLTHCSQGESKPTLNNSHLEKLEAPNETHSSNVVKQIQNVEIEPLEDTKFGDAGDSQVLEQKVVRRKVLNQRPKKHSKKKKSARRKKSKLFSRSFWCHDCGRWFSSQETLYQHLKEHNAAQPFKCGFCSARFKTRENEIAHRKKHKSVDGRYHCQRCEFSHDGPWGVIRHMQSHFPKEASSASHHVDQKQELLDEAKPPKLQTTAKPELHKETPAQSFKCSLCPSIFKTLKQKNVHVIKKHKDGEGLYVCIEDDCSYSCNLVSAMVKHIQTHPQKQVYRCALCGEPFNDLNQLARHDRKVHFRGPKTNKNHRCDRCSASFNNKANLQRHKLIHTGERPYKCAQCSKTFGLHYILKNHQRTHTGERPYKCAQCSKTFSLPHTLKIHQRTHTGERPYKCDECSGTFTRPFLLKEHKRLHTGELPSHKCEHCSQLFSLWFFKKHYKKCYSGARPQGSNSTPAALKAHVKTHSMKTSFHRDQ